jgi:peptidoglycan hydrolase CwlO-like protein
MTKFKRWTFIVIGIALLIGVLVIGTTQQNFGQSQSSDRLMIEQDIKTAITAHDADIKRQLANLQSQIITINRKLDEIKRVLKPEEGGSSIPKKK